MNTKKKIKGFKKMFIVKKNVLNENNFPLKFASKKSEILCNSYVKNVF